MRCSCGEDGEVFRGLGRQRRWCLLVARCRLYGLGVDFDSRSNHGSWVSRVVAMVESDLWVVEVLIYGGRACCARTRVYVCIW